MSVWCPARMPAHSHGCRRALRDQAVAGDEMRDREIEACRGLLDQTTFEPVRPAHRMGRDHDLRRGEAGQGVVDRQQRIRVSDLAAGVEAAFAQLGDRQPDAIARPLDGAVDVRDPVAQTRVGLGARAARSLTDRLPGKTCRRRRRSCHMTRDAKPEVASSLQLPLRYEQPASARWGRAQAPHRSAQGADRQQLGTRCVEGHHAAGAQRVHLLGRGRQAGQDPGTSHSPDPGGARGRHAQALLLARVQAPRAPRSVAIFHGHAGHARPVSRAGAIVRRTLVSFYDDQMTHHAAALTYYALMSLFPAVLLALSLLGLLGQYPDTYNSIIGYLREVAPAS